MKKILTLFIRSEADPRLVTPRVTPGCEWVIRGEGHPTFKWDGTAVMVRGGAVFARFDAKPGRTRPAGWEPCEEAPDAKGHHPGWVPADRTEDRYLREAAANAPGQLTDGTYEACGPKINGNPHGFSTHVLVPHGSEPLAGPSVDGAPRTFDELREWFRVTPIEGVVWHHADGRMAKAKRRDFGFPWPDKGGA